MAYSRSEQRILERFMLLSIATAIATIGLKVWAAVITGSVGFLSDAMESGVNLAAALVGFWALKVAVKPADANHQFGHGKAEYISALVEGALIFVASGFIISSAITRLMDPQPLEEPGLGLALSTLASALNLVVGMMLIRAGKKYRSATLDADGHHLMTDVWTSVGVLVGIALVYLTGWLILDPIVALVVGANICWTGYKLLRQSFSGLLSEALPKEEMNELRGVLADFAKANDVIFTDLRTVASGRQRFVYTTLQVPGSMTVARSHEIADELELTVDKAFPGAESFIHIEPLGTAPKPHTLAGNAHLNHH